MRGRPIRQLWWCWALMGVSVLVLLAAGRTAAPVEGVSDDRLFAIAAQLKCQTCVGESVADSQSASAVQFRQEIGEQMARGRTDAEIVSFFVQRYGDEVVLTPPASGLGSLVWILPVVAVAGAVALLGSTFRRWGRETDAVRHATEQEERRVADALRSRSSGGGSSGEGSSGEGSSGEGS